MRRRLLHIIGFGTQGYPEKDARRMRAANITTWTAAATISVFVLKSPFDIDPLTVLAIAAFAAIPLLHRFGPTVAATGLVLVAFAHVARLTTLIGTGDAIWVAFLTTAPLSILLFGTERPVFAGAFAVLGTALAVMLRIALPFDTGYLSSSALALNFTINFSMNAVLLFVIVYYVSRSAALAEAAVQREYARSEALLANILPPAVAARLKNKEVVADRYEVASVLFADMAGFTERASDTDPADLVEFLNNAFTLIDGLVETFGLEKIKTTGDSYMVVAGVPGPRADHAQAIADLALAISNVLSDLKDPHGIGVPVRIGIASGPVVAGVVGQRKFFYDVWGDTVNVAARMEQTGEPGRIQVDPVTHALVQDNFTLEGRGQIEVRGKGKMHTWFLIGRKIGIDPPRQID